MIDDRLSSSRRWKFMMNMTLVTKNTSAGLYFPRTSKQKKVIMVVLLAVFCTSRMNVKNDKLWK